MSRLSASSIKCHGCGFFNWVTRLSASSIVSRLFASSIEQGFPPPQLIVKTVCFNWFSIISSIDPQGCPLPQSIIKTVCSSSWLSRLFASSIACQGYQLPRLSVEVVCFNPESRLSTSIKSKDCPLLSSVEVVPFNQVWRLSASITRRGFLLQTSVEVAFNQVMTTWSQLSW